MVSMGLSTYLPAENFHLLQGIWLFGHGMLEMMADDDDDDDDDHDDMRLMANNDEWLINCLVMGYSKKVDTG